MSESKKPFTELVSRSNQNVFPQKLGWIMAGVMTVALIVVVLCWATALGKLRGLEALRAKLNAANTSLANALDQSQKDQGQISDLQSKVADLEQEKAQAAQAANNLENEMRSDLESKDVTITNLLGKLTVTILDRVMVDSGEASLKPDGEMVLRKVAAILAEHPNLQIQVVGHTDNVPVHTRFASNWELSTARALAAVHFLTEKAGVDPRRVGAAGYGQYRPIADNSTPEGRARNRRIAITILPDDLSLTDAGPITKPPANPADASPATGTSDPPPAALSQ